MSNVSWTNGDIDLIAERIEKLFPEVAENVRADNKKTSGLHYAISYCAYNIRDMEVKNTPTNFDVARIKEALCRHESLSSQLKLNRNDGTFYYEVPVFMMSSVDTNAEERRVITTVGAVKVDFFASVAINRLKHVTGVTINNMPQKPPRVEVDSIDNKKVLKGSRISMMNYLFNGNESERPDWKRNPMFAMYNPLDFSSNSFK
jgi:hypothetical protein